VAVDDLAPDACGRESGAGAVGAAAEVDRGLDPEAGATEVAAESVSGSARVRGCIKSGPIGLKTPVFAHEISALSCKLLGGLVESSTICLCVVVPPVF
jgi:hypothetical protein